MEEVATLRSRYFQFGIALGLAADDLEATKEEYSHNVEQALNRVILLWLRQKYDVQKHGLPSWRKLVKVISSSSGGQNPALAKTIAFRHQGVSFEPI